MHLIRRRNAHTCLPYGLRYLAEAGQPEGSRDGDVLVAPGPVVTIYDQPTERVVFWPERDANPFFHFFEGLWMLAGRNDLALPQRFVSSFDRFSDDGETLHGAYGHRWRQWRTPVGSHVDQLDRVVELMSGHSRTRRAVITMWDPNRDLFSAQGKDVPCNTQLYLAERYGRANERNQLELTVLNRSNDIVMGLYGANAVHLSMLQEYLAARLDLEVGPMYTLSNNYHAYARDYTRVRTGDLARWLPAWDECPYARGEVAPYPLVADPTTWDNELRAFFLCVEIEAPEDFPAPEQWRNPLFPEVAYPLWVAHGMWMEKRWEAAAGAAACIAATDWRKAVFEWLRRRAKKADALELLGEQC